jgi:hypothetical protein
MRPISWVMSSRLADGGADLEARHDRDVVDRQDVGRVGHGDEQRALVDVGDRDRLVALGRRGAEQVRGGHVDREVGEVEVVEAVALGDAAGELLLGDVAALEEDLLDGHPAVAGLLLGQLDVRVGREAERHEGVGERASAAAAPRRRGDSLDRGGGRAVGVEGLKVHGRAGDPWPPCRQSPWVP